MSEYFSLDKPNLKNIDVKKVTEALFNSEGQKLRGFIDSLNEPDYLFWDKVKYKEPLPNKDLTKEELWQTVKMMRHITSINTIIKNEKGGFFTWLKLPQLEKFFHEVDMNTGGELFVLKSDFDKATKQKLISRGVMEEAIASSQLEGASTSRRLAKQFLREGRKPRNESEKMILNNYLSMKAIEDGYKDKKMSLSLLYELHGSITKDTLTPEGEVPRLRNKGEDIFVVDRTTGIIYHKAPDIDFVKEELERFVKFANDELDDSFIHPIVKAIMIHFWIAYLHPFTDGNGRLARLLFYWYLLKNGYWAFAYLPISKIIKKSPKQYSMAYVYSEQDDNDLTYFIDYNIAKIKMAVKEFKTYLHEQTEANKVMNKVVRTNYDLNDRQIRLLQYLHGDSEARTSIKIHSSINQITRKTATQDLKKLAALGFLDIKQVGRKLHYFANKKIEKLFKQ
ncbi:MAG: Uncharacterized protein G01um101413_322 [Parcubacteria group bacterium Gr01-1014_13]|nr:MAG: Uncharacterized protein G01um101413_322 [Parcubacteria group bacterium Gr01-1014_13]